MTQSEWGACREVWFATGQDPLDSTKPTNYYAFLVDDSATHEQSSPVSRSLHLGDSIDTGPHSTWTQKSWIGGLGAQEWRDEQMFWHSTPGTNTVEPDGRVKLWPGWRSVFNSLVNPSGIKTIRLWGGANQAGSPLTTSFWGSDTAGVLRRFNGYGTSAITAASYGSAILSFAPMGEDEGYNVSARYGVGLQNGEFWSYDSATDVSTGPDAACPPNDGIYAMASMNKVMYAILRNRGGVFPNAYSFYKRTRAGGVTTWTLVSDLTQVNYAQDMVVWNSKLWFMGTTNGNETIIFSSDGSTVVEAFRIQDFLGVKLQLHYGSLYIGGDYIVVGNDASPVPLRHTQIFKYNGAALTELFSQGRRMKDSGSYGTPFGDMASWGKYLIWTRDYCHLTDEAVNNPSLMLAFSSDPCIMMYDAENDAISTGPSIRQDPSGLVGGDHVFLTALCVVDDRPIVAAYDSHTYTAGVVEKPWCIAMLRTPGLTLDDGFTIFSGVSFGYNSAQARKAEVWSAVYDAGLPAEDKLWMALVVRCRITSADQSIVLTVYNDDLTSVTKTIDYDPGNDGWRTEVLSLDDSVKVFTKSKTVRVKATIQSDIIVNNTSEIDYIAMQFVEAPRPRRMWRLRIPLSDGQVSIEGTASPLSTRQALEDKLKEYYNTGRPVYMWGPYADSIYPGPQWSNTPRTTVFIKDYSITPYRRDSTGTQVDAVCTLTLLEVV